MNACKDYCVVGVSKEGGKLYVHYDPKKESYVLFGKVTGCCVFTKHNADKFSDRLNKTYADNAVFVSMHTEDASKRTIPV